MLPEFYGTSKLVTCPYSDLLESISRPPILLFKIHHHIIIQFVSFRFAHQCPAGIYLILYKCHMPCQSYNIFRDLITLIVFGEEYK